MSPGKNHHLKRSASEPSGIVLQGIYNLPNCGTDEDDPHDLPTGMCLTIQRLVATGAYLPLIRTNLIQAQYFKVGCCHCQCKVVCG